MGSVPCSDGESAIITPAGTGELEISSLVLGCCRAVSDHSQPRSLPGLGFSWAAWVHQSCVVSPGGSPHISSLWPGPEHPKGTNTHLLDILNQGFMLEM